MNWFITEQTLPKEDIPVVGCWENGELSFTEICYYHDGEWLSVSDVTTDRRMGRPDYWTDLPSDVRTKIKV
jgi:hypothetical protein